ncbi:hypothetical protein [Flammeovirga kamogawensis]|uniref:DUF4919 domain-containing protein n=1 Tax=Flammeovirga kamogawensis TaxID=373891 RepID=A0ABX8H1P7_9BACT|nr:hypothetical protein [Flammeovirga kamogawensis]MBB6463738.1 hypothetical protein [Flammeovirga kamogawensis]QWG09750.1 hypothetical protein KM029_24435 [Flammeovirga kamogawensis]TRX65263.1 hypothetical protein EO216_22325 [Flammeovirga kamogawensis]
MKYLLTTIVLLYSLNNIFGQDLTVNSTSELDFKLSSHLLFKSLNEKEKDRFCHALLILNSNYDNPIYESEWYTSIDGMSYEDIFLKSLLVSSDQRKMDKQQINSYIEELSYRKNNAPDFNAMFSFSKEKSIGYFENLSDININTISIAITDSSSEYQIIEYKLKQTISKGKKTQIELPANQLMNARVIRIENTLENKKIDAFEYNEIQKHQFNFLKNSLLDEEQNHIE